MKEPWIIYRYEKSTPFIKDRTDPKKKLYDLIHANASAISEITDSQVKLGKLEGTAVGINAADLPSLFVVRQGSTKT